MNKTNTFIFIEYLFHVKINSSHKFSVKTPWTGCQSRLVTNLDVLSWRHFVKIPLKQGVFFWSWLLSNEITAL